MCILVHLWESDWKLDMKKELSLLLHVKDCKKGFLRGDSGCHVFHCLVLV